MAVDTVDEHFAAQFAAAFADTWRSPDLDAFEALWSDDVVLIQPLMGTLRGKQACRAGFARLFQLVPDLTGEVHSHGHGEHTVFIEFTLSGTFGGAPITWRAVDRFTFENGVIAERISFFDAVPVAMQMLRRPRGWGRLLTSRVLRPRLASRY